MSQRGSTIRRAIPTALLVFALAVALLTVSWQSVRAAAANPVDSLRYE